MILISTVLLAHLILVVSRGEDEVLRTCNTCTSTKLARTGYELIFSYSPPQEAGYCVLVRTYTAAGIMVCFTRAVVSLLNCTAS